MKDVPEAKSDFMTIEDVGKFLGSTLYPTYIHTCSQMQLLISKTVPVNLKDQDAFHLTIEEYLHALISLVEELVCSFLPSIHTHSC